MDHDRESAALPGAHAPQARTVLRHTRPTGREARTRQHHRPDPTDRGSGTGPRRVPQRVGRITASPAT
ncbi:hypothetical protein, partial [Streptomyces niveiscabiei]|uniref:hypothetical protein n=1 Tax=Streptomyces niveiscabiei TaxID=164115 RepID=UPI001980B391